MKAVNIKSYLRAATLADMIFLGEIIENREVYYRSVRTNEFEGPIQLNKNKDVCELLIEFGLHMLYVIDQKDITEASIAFKLPLVQASITDFQDRHKEFLHFRTFYLMNVKNAITGPFYVSDNTNVMQLKTDLRNQVVYKLAPYQKITTLITAKTG